MRRELFARIGARSKRALIVTEGLLIYLGDADVKALAMDLHAIPSFARWVIDLASPRLLKMMSKSWGKAAAKGNAPFRFAPASGTEFFRELGWDERAFHSTMEEAERLHREMKGAAIWRFLGRFYPARMREEFKRMSGTVVLERA
jgi:O-methyltransferase involved in polyketide biosynthesis